jgi:uncharacterized membrane protein
LAACDERDYKNITPKIKDIPPHGAGGYFGLFAFLVVAFLVILVVLVVLIVLIVLVALIDLIAIFLLVFGVLIVRHFIFPFRKKPTVHSIPHVFIFMTKNAE